MTFKSQLQSDLMSAMKARDEIKISALRMFKSAVMKFEVSGKEKVEATDDDVLKILKKEVKQRRDSIEQFEAGGRKDLADVERAQLAILEAYLPNEMTEDQIRTIVEQVILQLNAKGPSDMGKVMGMVMGKVSGQADGSVVKRVVQKVLAEG